jgi:transcriptional regulator with XRE-family HTH domain
MLNPLKRFRAANQITQAALAERLGVTDVTVSRWETGERKIARSLLPAVSKMTGIPATELRPDLAKLMAG